MGYILPKSSEVICYAVDERPREEVISYTNRHCSY
jgi:hypothetical protein